MCLANGVIAKGEGIPCPVDDAGCFTAEVTDFAGMYVKVRPGKDRWSGLADELHWQLSCQAGPLCRYCEVQKNKCAQEEVADAQGRRLKGEAALCSTTSSITPL